MDDHQTRMLSGLTGLGGLGQGDPNDPDPVRKQQDIGDILQQIMAITDESLDEAQARYLLLIVERIMMGSVKMLSDLHRKEHVRLLRGSVFNVVRGT